MNSSGDPRYFISVSFGWRYVRTSELMINNFKGFIIDKNNSDKVVAEFSLDKIKDLEKSIQVLTESIISKNYLVSDNNKFIDVQDHFMKMNMKCGIHLDPIHMHPRELMLIMYTKEES